MFKRMQEEDWGGALEAAEAVAPYLHAKLSQSDVRVQLRPQRSDLSSNVSVALARQHMRSAASHRSASAWQICSAFSVIDNVASYRQVWIGPDHGFV
jgi:hypothetical protein